MRKGNISRKMLAVLLACSMLPWSSVPVQAAVTNLALSAQATSSSYESGTTFTSDKVKDGDLTTRWATGQNVAENEWINLHWDEAKTIQQVNIHFERTDANQNILSYQVQFLNGSNEVDSYVKNEKAKQIEKIQLTEAVLATDVKLTILSADAGTNNWKNVGICEVEVFEEINQTHSLEDVKNLIQGGTSIATDVTRFSLPEVPEGFSIKINGADFEQIIANDGSIHHPLTDKTVKVSYQITEAATNETLVTDDYTYTVAGTKTQAAGQNEKPSIIPEIQEWYSESTETLMTDSVTKVVYDNEALEPVAEEFISDYQELTGITLAKEKNAEKQAGAFNFSLNAPDELLGDEGYTMEILSDRINVASKSAVGNMYGMQTILQMYQADHDGFPVGQMRDYPRFSVRGFVFDVARKPVSLEMIKDIARTMRYYKMNDFHVHLSDNYIWLEDYGTHATENEGFKAYDAFRLESGLSNSSGETPTAKDYSISKADFRSFIQEQRAVGVKIVPEIDLPAHANSFTKVWPELKVTNQVSNGHSLIDHLNIAEAAAVDKIKEIFDDYTKDQDGVPATFDSETTVHIGADEFLTNATAYRNYLNTIVPYVKESNPVRMWGGLSWIKDNPVTQIAPNAIENVEINLWSKDWADGLEMYNMGYKLINTIDDYGYMVPNGNGGRGSYGDFLNTTKVYDSFEANLVRTGSGYRYVPSGDDQMLGAAFAIWSDNIDKRASGLTESDLYYRFFDAMPFYAEKTWAATGKEKGSAAAVSALAEKMGTGPNTNPYYREDTDGTIYESYDFEPGTGLKDESENQRDLTVSEDSTARILNGALRLNGGNSHVTTPIDKMGNGNALSFEITLTEDAEAGDIIFEADAPYGTHDIRIMENGKLGFTRELYNYYFDYELPVGTPVYVKIVTSRQATQLYVNGSFVSNATGKFIHNDIEKKTGITNATFALPLERIGSETNAIHAVIDRVTVAKADTYDKTRWSGSTNSETTSGESKGGTLAHAFDNDPDTIWHSNWNGATDQLTDGKTYYAEIDLGQAYKINRFSFTPRQDKTPVSGAVTEADLYYSENGEEWILLETQQEPFAEDKTTKTFEFATKNIRYLKFVAKNSNDKWVAISEFDVNYVPEAQCQVIVSASAGGTVLESTRVENGKETTIVAIAEEGYRFEGWYNADGMKVSGDAEYTFTVEDDITLEARFVVINTSGDEDLTVPETPKKDDSTTTPEQNPEVNASKNSSPESNAGQNYAKPFVTTAASTGDSSMTMTWLIVLCFTMSAGLLMKKKSKCHEGE